MAAIISKLAGMDSYEEMFKHVQTKLTFKDRFTAVSALLTCALWLQEQKQGQEQEDKAQLVGLLSATPGVLPGVKLPVVEAYKRVLKPPLILPLELDFVRQGVLGGWTMESETDLVRKDVAQVVNALCAPPPAALPSDTRVMDQTVGVNTAQWQFVQLHFKSLDPRRPA